MLFSYIVALTETPPTISENEQPRSTYKRLNSRVILKCTATGYPQPEIKWFKDGNKVEGANTAQYVIKKLTLDTRGQYYCNVSNSLGYAVSKVAYVKIIGMLNACI